MTNYQRPTGTLDILPKDQPYWQYVRVVCQQEAERRGFERIDLPIFEFTPVFSRTAAGEGTDLRKEMYTFTDLDGQEITLRPEFTAGVVRAYIQNGLRVLPQPVKLYSIGPIFRHEKPAFRRYRQIQQFNAEIIGVQDPLADVEIMLLTEAIYQRIGFSQLSFQINSTGCPLCKPAYIQILVAYLQERYERLAEIDRERLTRNPLRVLDSKQADMDALLAQAPHIADHLCGECAGHFEAVCAAMDALGKPYTVNFRLVRGLDYYTKTVYEVWQEELGAGVALCGGGRYDGLAETLGGSPTPGVGFASGLERIVYGMQDQSLEPPPANLISVYLAYLGQAARPAALRLTNELHLAGLSTWLTFVDALGGKRSLKSQLREANKRGAQFAIILGENEIETGVAAVRDLQAGQQVKVAMEELIEWLNARL